MFERLGEHTYGVAAELRKSERRAMANRAVADPFRAADLTVVFVPGRIAECLALAFVKMKYCDRGLISFELGRYIKVFRVADRF